MNPIRTVASAPSACEVCDHHRRMRIVSISGWQVSGFMPCPHCSVDQPVEIHHYRYRTDIPKGGAA